MNLLDKSRNLDLAMDLLWIKTELAVLHYRDPEVSKRLDSVSERAGERAVAQQAGESDTWERLRASSSQLARGLDAYRDMQPEDLPFPFKDEKADFLTMSSRAETELAAAAK
jgi:hypothetical protein